MNEREELDRRGLLPDPNLMSSQSIRAVNAIMKTYGNVIGRHQAENIVFTVLIAARAAAIEELKPRT